MTLTRQVIRVEWDNWFGKTWHRRSF